MKMTATQKILASHSGKEYVKSGDLILAKVDLILANDITAPVAIREFEKTNKPLFNPDKLVLVLDHFVPNKDINSAQQCKLVRDFANTRGVSRFYDAGSMGVEHALLPEQGLVLPSTLIVGADSHTCTYGALGCFSTGVGSTDAAMAMATGKVWLKVPSAIKVVLKGKLPKFVCGKDIVLQLIKILGVDGATYKSLEFFGDLDNLSIDDKFTIANMAVECGAKNAFFPCDDSAISYLTNSVNQPFDTTSPDSDAEYDEIIEIDMSSLSPSVAFPHLPSNVKTFDEFFKIKIDQVVIGSCTNGRLSDLAVAASILKEKKVAKGVRCIVIPATPKIYKDALRLGYIETFIKAGACVSTPTCGCCLGGFMGVLAEGERCVATTNRNFVGRMGHSKSEIYLASPAIAAASALTGFITSPLEV